MIEVSTSFDSEGNYEEDDLDDDLDPDQSESFSESIEQEVEQEHAYIVMETPDEETGATTVWVWPLTLTLTFGVRVLSFWP